MKLSGILQVEARGRSWTNHSHLGVFVLSAPKAWAAKDLLKVYRI